MDAEPFRPGDLMIVVAAWARNRGRRGVVTECVPPHAPPGQRLRPGEEPRMTPDLVFVRLDGDGWSTPYSSPDLQHLHHGRPAPRRPRPS